MAILSMLMTATGVLASILGGLFYCADGSFCASDFDWLPASTMIMQSPVHTLVTGVALVIAGMSIHPADFD